MMDKEGEAPVKKTYLYFENLDGVRAIAAILVVVSHIEYHKPLFGLQRFTGINLHNLGKVGVTIFFSLSGFLITYLLLEEKESFKKINMKDFYIRRILRIWPLYFLIVITGFFIYPAQGSAKALLLSTFFLPNLAFSLALLPAIFDPIWSIGTEEQFYMFHPHIFKIKKLQNILYVLIALTIGFVVVAGITRAFEKNSVVLKDLGQLLYYARFTNMLIGAMVAVIYYNSKHQKFKFIFQGLFDKLFNKYVQLAALLLLAGFIYFFIQHEIPQGDIVISVLSSIAIVNFSESKTSILNLSNAALKYCGKISYGIYLLHKFPLFLVLFVAGKYMPNVGMLQQNLFIYTATFLSAIALASVSYYGYERYFLRLKARFQKVKSNNLVS